MDSSKQISNSNLSKLTNINDKTLMSLTSKYEILNENLNNLINALNDHKKDFTEFQGGNESIPEYINEKAKKIEDNVGASINRMDGEVQKSLSHQKSENLRLYQQINQLKKDNTVIKNQLLDIEKRIEDINLQIGSDFVNIKN